MCKKIYSGESESFLSQFESDTLREVAKLKYLEGLTIPQIAEKMSYCTRQIDRFIKKIKTISEVTNDTRIKIIN